MNPILIVIALSAAGVMGDYCIKIAGNGKQYIDRGWFIIGMLIYASTAFGWFYAMKHIKLSSLGVIYALTTVLLLVVVGIFSFNEKLNVYEIIGMIGAITSIILLGRFA